MPCATKRSVDVIDRARTPPKRLRVLLPLAILAYAGFREYAELCDRLYP